MMQNTLKIKTPFHALASACELADAERLLPVFASSAVEVFPYQVAAARFVLGSEYLKGVVLCDEGSLGKTYEALLVIAQYYFEKRDKILIVVPLPLLRQWRQVLNEQFSIEYKENDLADGVILATYEWVVANTERLSAADWDLVVLEEAHRLRKENKESAIIKHIAGRCKFKLLLTATPMQNSILDLHGLISIIDHTALLNEKEFYKRYFRKPENYPELAALVSKYCFRTTRLEVQNYVKIPHRNVQTIGYTYSESESILDRMITDYLTKDNLEAFPTIERYDLALMLFRAFSSSGAALRNLLTGVLKRMDVDDDISAMLSAIPAQDTKAIELLKVLKSTLSELKKRGASTKVLIFTENRSTQNMLDSLLTEHGYKVAIYHGGEDKAVQEFSDHVQILIATDAASEGFNLGFCSFVINYDLPYSAMTLEQRINRCHRQGQKSDVLIVNFLNRHNFADVRTFELMNKRLTQFQGIIGLSDDLLGKIGGELSETLQKLRPVKNIENEFAEMLETFAEPNMELLSESKATLFHSFTPEVAKQVKLTPEYVREQSALLNDKLWALTCYFFAKHPEFQIDDESRTIRCFGPMPKVFTGARMGRDEYSMNSDYRPRSGLHTLTGSLTRNMLEEIFWCGVPSSGTITLDVPLERCRIALYQVDNRKSVYAGKTASGRILDDKECRKIMTLPVDDYVEYGENIGGHNRHLHSVAPDELDQYVEIKKTGLHRERERKCDKLKAQSQATKKALENPASRLEKIRLQKEHSLAVKAWKEAEQNNFLAELEPKKTVAKLNRLFLIDIKSGVAK